jgi:hypothetical protein
MGARLVKEVSTKTNDVAGDGTTTATVLAQAMIKEGVKNVAAGADPMAIKRGIDKAVEETVKGLKEITSPNDVQDSKFIICNELSSNYNGNVSYSMDIKPLTEEKYMNFNGWKLIELKFPGCWFGQTGYSVLEDPYGVRGKFEVTRQASYKDNKMNMLKMALNRTQEFVDENFSIEYYDFIKKYRSVLSLSNIERVKDLLHATQKYIEEYSGLKSRILQSTNEKKDSY